MNYKTLNSNLGKIDIYLLDQIMKNRYNIEDLILDAGCGNGRNIVTLNNLGFNIIGCDQNKNTISKLHDNYPNLKLETAEISALPYASNKFDHVICNAVLHFANSNQHFIQMINELKRVLKSNGTLFIRMTSIFTLPNYKPLSNDRFELPDGTTRFLLQEKQLEFLKTNFNLLDPLKTVNVDNVRCMSTLMLRKHELATK